MQKKQEQPAENSAAVINEITNIFREVKLPYLAEKTLYTGIPHSVLDAFCSALNRQRFEDEETRFARRLRYSGIYKERTEDTFRWDDNTYPLAGPGMIENILTLDFVRQRKNLIIPGPSGTGKTMLSIIVACKAIRENFSVKYRTSHEIVTELQEAKSGNSLSGCIKKYKSCDLLIIDDLTYATLDKKSAQAFFSIIDKRYSLKSTIITSNTNIKTWIESFPDKSMCSAMLGRIQEEALMLNMNGAKDMRLQREMDMLDDMLPMPQERK